MTLRDLRTELIRILSPVAGESADTEAEWLLSETLEKKRSFLFAHPEYEPDEQAVKTLQSRGARRAAGEPLQYILQNAPFMGFDFYVCPDVLIPRADTEILVETALPFCKGKKVLDVCTGSGCIAISVAKLAPGSCVSASDISGKALRVARRNAERLCAKIDFYQSDFLRDLPAAERFDVILSNPPYITEPEMAKLPDTVRRFEPELALYGGTDGLAAYRTLLSEIPERLNEGGRFCAEIGWTQGNAVAALFRENGFTSVEIHRDYGGRDRVVSGAFSGN